MENLFTQNYDDDFEEIGFEEGKKDEIGIYRYLPQMLPWVGNEYGRSNSKKILLVGESHYLRNYVQINPSDKAEWYYTKQSEIEEEDVAWTNTREIVLNGPRNWVWGAHSLYIEVNKIICELKNQDFRSDNMFRYVAFYNYFLRPAYSKGASLKKTCQEKDLEVAFDAFREIVATIKPDYVYFLSKFAWESVMMRKYNFEGIKMDFSPHPCCSWWRREKYTLENHNELLKGREKFMLFLKENEIF